VGSCRIVETHAARAEEMAHERVVLLATAHGESNKVARRVSVLEGELRAAHQAWGATEVKLPTLADKAATTYRRRVGVEEQCERLVHEITLLNLEGSKLCMTITGAPPQAPLHEGMRFVAAHHTEVVMQLYALGNTVSGRPVHTRHLPINVSQAGAVGEMVARF
jgi:hypothetical protein